MAGRSMDLLAHCASFPINGGQSKRNFFLVLSLALPDILISLPLGMGIFMLDVARDERNISGTKIPFIAEI